MNNDTIRESSARTLRRPAIIAAIFLGLHLLPLVWRPDALWGVDFLLYLPTPVQVIFILLAVPLFVPGFRLTLREWANALPFALWGRGGRVWFTRVLILLIALAAFLSLSSARHFLGDGYRLLEKLEANASHDWSRSPLSYAVIHALHDFGQGVWQSAENTYRVSSYASGVLYVALSIATAGGIGKDALQKSVALGFLLTTGYMQLFFGYVENYALYMPGLLLYLLLGVRTLQRRMPLFAPALVLGMLLAHHRAFGIFGPSLLFLGYRAWLARRDRVSTWKNATITSAAMCCVPVCAAICLGVTGVDFKAYLGQLGDRDFLPMFENPNIEKQYPVFSLAHILDFLNQQLLAAPAACMALFVLRPNDVRRQPFLALCAAVPLLFTFIASPELGAFADWDIFSLPALPLTLLTASALVDRIRDRKRLFHGAFLFCGTAALHTALWTALNASAVSAEARYVRHLGRVTGHGAIAGWLTLGNYYERQDNVPAAIQAYKRSRDANPTDPNRWLSVGAIFLDMGRTSDAIRHFQKAIELQPGHAVPYMNLGAAYSDMGQYDKAIEYTRKAIALQPNLAAAHRNLGAIFRRTGQLSKAFEHLSDAYALQPEDAAIHRHLGLTYHDAGEIAKAIRNLERANVLQPRHPTTLLNLAVLYNDAGRNDRAIQLLKEAIEIQPGFTYAYLTLGDTYYNMGEHENAIPYYRKAIQLEPNHANAHLLLGLSYRSLKRGDEARAYFEKTLELEPGHPQAEQIRRWLGRSEE